jgi:hypothetical protein
MTSPLVLAVLVVCNVIKPVSPVKPVRPVIPVITEERESSDPFRLRTLAIVFLVAMFCLAVLSYEISGTSYSSRLPIISYA